jgi:hypothetical protein
VPLPDGRALISLDSSMALSDFELKLIDAIDADGNVEEDRSILSSIAEILKHARQTRGISLHERSIIVLTVGAKGWHARPGKVARTGKGRRVSVGK